MQKKWRTVGRVLAVVAPAVLAGACGAQSKSEPSTQDSLVAPLSTSVSALANDLGAASDSVMRKLGFGPPNVGAAGAEDDAAKESPAAPAAPMEVRRPTPRPKPAPVAVPAVVDPAPLVIATAPTAVEEPVPDQLAADKPIATGPVAVAPVVSEMPFAVDDSIYTVANLDVAPPVLRSADLPRWRPSDGPSADAVEVTVSRDGGVERIRLVSEPRRMIDMMALSAAKMWRFDPALKNGAPVRYRLILLSPTTTRRY